MAEFDKMRRKHPRKQFIGTVGILCAGEYVVTRASEIGEGGLSVETDYILNEGSIVVLTFRVPSSVFTTVKAEVKSCRKGKNGLCTIGFAFVDLAFDLRKQIRAYVSSGQVSLLNHLGRY